MTIEERAKTYADNYCVGDASIIVDLVHKVAKEAYKAGATEQKAIDNELLKRVHKGVLDKAIREKKEVAMKAYCKRCQDMGGGYPCSHKCQEYCDFEKTLEE